MEQASSGSPEEGLPAVKQLRALVDQWEEAQVRAARERGFRWAEIGRLLGRHRQAVHREFAKKLGPSGWTDGGTASTERRPGNGG